MPLEGAGWDLSPASPQAASVAIYGSFLDFPKASAAPPELLPLVSRPPWDLVEAMVSLAGAGSGAAWEYVVRSATYLAASQGNAVGLIRHFITREVTAVQSGGKDASAVLFRQNSEATKMFATYAKMAGVEYGRAVVLPTIKWAFASTNSRPVIESLGKSQRETEAGGVEVELEGEALEEALEEAQRALDRIFASSSRLPLDLRSLMSHVHREVSFFAFLSFCLSYMTDFEGRPWKSLAKRRRTSLWERSSSFG